MTFEDFTVIIAVPAKYQRRGQRLMNELFKVRQDLYEFIAGTDYDCFYDDSRTDDTLVFLSENWYSEE